MELFYSCEITDGFCSLDPEESSHCVRVLRHRAGDEICVIDGGGAMYECSIADDSPKGVRAAILKSHPEWHAHPYSLTLAVAPTKNNDRYEWFAEKATEVGVDRICPIIGEHSERRVYKTERLKKIVLSATKQSLKAALPAVDEPCSVKDFIKAHAESSALKLIAYCFEGETLRHSIKQVLNTLDSKSGDSEIVVMIGPEGDFSESEARMAIASGFVPIHLGDSRLRTETAAVTAAEAVYFRFMEDSLSCI